MFSRRSAVSILTIALIAMALLPAGCKSQHGEQITRVHYYGQCYDPIQKLRDDEHSVAKSTAVGAVTGAAVGALIGGLGTGSWKGAAAGAVGGGAAGAVGGNIYGKKQAQKRDAAYIAEYAAQLNEDLEGMNRTLAAARVASQCYLNSFDAAVESYRRKQITKDELLDRYAEIRAGLQEISYVVNKRYDDMAAKDEELDTAIQAAADADAKKEAEKARKTTRKAVAKKQSEAKSFVAANDAGLAHANSVISDIDPEFMSHMS